MHASTTLFQLFLFIRLALAGLPGLPGKIYGVNLGSWLVLESWMLPQEWLDMGGEQCSDCSSCIATEFAFAKAYPHTVDEIFAKHWSSWFNQADVDALVDAGINTVRIPLGYWIVEQLVDRKAEFYPRGGLAQLRRGLKQLQKAGIVAILDHHALPGVQTPNQMFTGRCTSDVQFYAVNEPIMDATQTPGYGDFQENFVRVVRATEFLLGVPAPGFPFVLPAPADGNFTAMLGNVKPSALFTPEVISVLLDAAPILLEMGVFGLFMDINWQFNNPANPADAAIGPQGYDNHLYYVSLISRFGGVADPNPTAYLTSICRNSPLWFGGKPSPRRVQIHNAAHPHAEWGLPVQFTATDQFLRQWADAQKLAYSKGAGWIFWNFKVEKSALAGNLSREWSYLEGVRLGYLTKDPSQVHDPNVCAPFAITTLTPAQISAFRPYSFYAAAAYCSPDSTSAWNCGTNCEGANPAFQPIASGGDGDAVQFWYVGVDESLGTIIVAHQGTDTREILSLVTDANFFLASLQFLPNLFPGLSASIEVHSGFLHEHFKTATQILDAVLAGLDQFDVHKVTLVGHSLGGALALLDSVFLPLHLPKVAFQTIVYGMPRVGNQAFADYASIGNTVTHINNKEDFVPILPGRSLGFRHPTGEIHIQDSGDWDSCPGQDNTNGLCTTGDVSLLNGRERDHDGPYDGVLMDC
ncbi:glycoside hydrolase family 5 protein [Favolaschia claudopus]|uniref:Glycoside hydrolase family 5 protein n=1 Tax=Favolaschia claudopus TaxID=2862362 RepID=A0AAW0C039_9AGAR